MSKPKFQAVTGMHDILPQDQVHYERVQEVLKKIFSFYDFERIDTPILEDAGLFVRSIGENTDIVEKEMFSLRTKGKDLLVMRPEGTAPVMRSYIEHGFVSLPQPVRLWYYGPFFRYGKAAGRKIQAIQPVRDRDHRGKRSDCRRAGHPFHTQRLVRSGTEEPHGQDQFDRRR